MCENTRANRYATAPLEPHVADVFMPVPWRVGTGICPLKQRTLVYTRPEGTGAVNL